MKNLHAGAEYRTWLVAVTVLGHVLLLALPPLVLLWTDGLAWWLNLGSVVPFLWQGVAASRGFGTAWWAGVRLPPLALFGAYLLVRATWLTLRNDGIDGRGTHCALAELRANVV